MRKTHFVFAALSVLALLPSVLFAASWENISDAIATQEGKYDSPAIYDRRCGGMAVDPVTGAFFLDLSNKAVYKSTDHGNTYVMSDGGFITMRVLFSSGVSQDFGGSGRIAFFGIWGRGGMTANCGKSWSFFNVTVMNGFDMGDVDWSSALPKTAIAVDHENGNTNRISTNSGKTWRSLGIGPNKVGVINPSTIVRGTGSGIQVSTDTGATWSNAFGEEPVNHVPKHFGATTYWMTSSGIIKTTNGKDWSHVGTNVPGAMWGPYFGINENQIMVINQDGFNISENGGQTWRLAAPWFGVTDSYCSPAYNTTGMCHHFGWDPIANILYTGSQGGSAFRSQLDWQTKASPRETRSLKAALTVTAVTNNTSVYNILGRRISVPVIGESPSAALYFKPVMGQPASSPKRSTVRCAIFDDVN